MYKSILVPIDLADTDLAKPAIATAATLSQTWSGAVRLLNVLPMTPVMLAEYVPADFDSQQRETSEEALSIVARESGIAAGRISGVVRQGGIYHEILGRGRDDEGRPDRDDLAPPGDAHLLPRLRTPATWCATPNARCWWCGTSRRTVRAAPNLHRKAAVGADARDQLSESIVADRLAAPRSRCWQRESPISRSARSSSWRSVLMASRRIQLATQCIAPTLGSIRSNPPEILDRAGGSGG